MHAKTHQAVILVPYFEGEVFFVKRKNNLSAFPGFTTFPGGKIEKEDELTETKITDQFPHINPVHLGALMREGFEEIKLDFTEVKSITHLGTALSPNFNVVRFNTSYYLLQLKTKPTFNELSEFEIDCGSWSKPEEIYAHFQLGQHLFVPPTLNVIKYLTENPQSYFPTNLEITSLGFNIDQNQLHFFRPIYDVVVMPILSNTLPPYQHTNSFIVGEINPTLIDPSPKDQEEFDKLLKTIHQHFKIKRILLTHAHPDHLNMAPQLAKSLKVPIYLSEKTKKWAMKRMGEDFFQGVELHFVRDGDIFDMTLNSEILISFVPGHDEGQIALSSKDKRWFIVGDLIQGMGSVVIAHPEGDMGDYFETLTKVINLNPQFIFPSHGMPMGGTYALEKNLNHRKLREEQIKLMLSEEKTMEEMVEAIYHNQPPIIQTLGRMTIDSHLRKLKADRNN
jgi:ribonuclease/clavin/mitogillin